MSYYHIKNISLNKKDNKISADLADSSFEPLTFYHVDDLFNKPSYEANYAEFIYNVVSGNFHPSQNNVYSKIMMNYVLENYYDDAHDIGKIKTYHKYEDVLIGLMTGDMSKVKYLESDRVLNPTRYYVLKPVDLELEYGGKYYLNGKGQLFNYTKDKGLQECEMREISTYGMPYGKPNDLSKYVDYNDFLQEDAEIEI